MDKILQYLNNSINREPIEKENLMEYIDEHIDYCMRRALDRNAHTEHKSQFATMYLFWKDIKKEVEKEL